MHYTLIPVDSAAMTLDTANDVYDESETLAEMGGYADFWIDGTIVYATRSAVANRDDADIIAHIRRHLP